MTNHKRILYIIAFLMVGFNQVKAQNITVSVAGNSATSSYGDGGASFFAQFMSPTDVCVDATNNIYVADNGSGKIRKISAQNGVITTIAGGGTSTADGIPATNAILSPAYMCLDNLGNLYVSTGNKIRVVNLSTGIITTIAGTGTAGYSGDGGPATAALLNAPGGICLDGANNLYLVDGGALVWMGSGSLVTHIRKIDASTGIISTIAGTGTAGYSGDGGPATAAQIKNSIAICVDAFGNVFFSDQPSTLSFGGGAYIRKISAATGIITTIGGTGGYPANGDGGPATAACLGNIYGMCIDNYGNLVLCDISCSCRRIDLSTGVINTIAGSVTIDGYNGDGGNSLSEYFSWPYGVCIDASGNLLIADNHNYRIRHVVQLTNTPTFVYGQGQYINTCPGTADSLANLLAIGDLGLSLVETWSVVAGPMHGTLTGFPATALSRGTDSVAIPVGTFYTSNSAYTGMDSFRIMVSNGTISSVITIYVYANMTSPGLLSGPSSTCVGSHIILADGNPNGRWGSYNTGIAITPIDSLGNNAIAVSAGTDTVYYSSSVGCDALQVAVETTPNAGTIAGSPTVCLATTTALTDAVTGGVWSAYNGNATVSGSGVVTGVLSGIDSIFYTVTNICGTAYTNHLVTIDICTTGLAIPSLSSSLAIFPNPASATLNIVYTNWQNDNPSIIITDITGRDVYKTALGVANGTGTAEIDVAALPAGVYFIKISGSEVQKFVKE